MRFARSNACCEATGQWYRGPRSPLARLMGGMGPWMGCFQASEATPNGIPAFPLLLSCCGQVSVGSPCVLDCLVCFAPSTPRCDSSTSSTAVTRRGLVCFCHEAMSSWSSWVLYFLSLNYQCLYDAGHSRNSRNLCGRKSFQNGDSQVRGT